MKKCYSYVTTTTSSHFNHKPDNHKKHCKKCEEKLHIKFCWWSLKWERDCS